MTQMTGLTDDLKQQFIHEADDNSFETEVIHRSMTVPVLVDCWAEWCGPCQALGPTLERLASQYKGRFELVKVDIDKAQRVAMALRVQSVPFMILFMNGRPVDALVGNQSERDLKDFLDRHLPVDEGDPYEIALEVMKQGQYQEALSYLQQALLEDSNRSDVRLAMARSTLALGDTEAAEQLILSIPQEHPEYQSAQKLKALFSLAEFQGAPAQLLEQIQSDHKNVDAWYRLGVSYAFQGQFKKACDALLKVVTYDRNYKDDAGRQTLLLIFEVLGNDNTIVNESRRSLANLLF